jgi:hypothetical protein
MIFNELSSNLRVLNVQGDVFESCFNNIKMGYYKGLKAKKKKQTKT